MDSAALRLLRDIERFERHWMVRQMAMPPVEIEPPAPKPAARFTGWKNAQHFAHHLARLGFRSIGHGLYSSVFAHPKSPGKVVKVGSQMDGWIEYVVWASRKGYAGTCAPKVHSLHIIKPQDGPAFYVAVMERLDVTVTRAEGENSRDPKRYTHALNAHAAVLDRCRSFRAPEYITALAGPHWANFIEAFQRDLEGAYWDLHEGNWMVRYDGSLVLTDPIACNGERPEWRANHKTPARVRSTDWAKLCPQPTQPAINHMEAA